jgi:ATP-dependent Lon protease
MEFEEVCDATELPEALPILPVRDAVIFPYMTIPLQIAREISMQALERALKEQRMLLLLSQKNARQDDPGLEDLYTTGTVCMIVRMLKEDDGRVKVLVQGLAKARVREIVFEEPHLFCKIDVIREPMLSSIPIEVEALMRSVRDTLDDFLGTKNLPNEILMLTENINDPGVLADLIAANLNLRVPEAQRLLECTDPVHRLEKVGEELHREIELTRMQTKIQSQAKEEISRTQREYYLREQLKAIQGELGDLDEKSDDIQSLRQQVESAGMPPEAEKEALKQLRRLDTMNIESAEASIVRGYLDWLVELPWSHSTQDNLDIKEVQRVLDEDHYNLKQVKDRILEYLSVRKLKEKMRGPILCFVGPPGVGKTSLGRSIARAMGREFVRVSIGGVHDEAEIRGHRRTYVGALPGRVIQGIKQVGSNNPVFMIDEVDKIGNDYRGDPASALLEVLDPEQNNRFSDHYLNIPFDLSKVMFITTANRLDLIPPTLRDRMEVIRISGYTEEEKVRIATTYLLPRQLDENGLTPENLVLSMSALRKTISEYTQEAGLRELERKINQVCRKVARRIAEEEGTSLRASVGTLHHYLGSPRFLPDEEQNHPQVGQAMGLAWTQAGGEVLCVEVSVVSGSGELTLTGQLGDVMKESARAALSYARASARKWGIPKDFYKSSDVHIHVPAGAIPKDGPSAGVAMAASLVSALTGRPVRHDVAMTGEITLRGRVLLVGGVKEKVLGAHRGKMTEVFLPSRNQRDLADIPSAVRKRVKLNFVNHVEEILDQVLLQETPKEAYDTGDIRIVKKALPLTGSEGCLE